jgi:hypothetical protein
MTDFDLAGCERDGFFVRERHDGPRHACLLHPATARRCTISATGRNVAIFRFEVSSDPQG